MTELMEIEVELINEIQNEKGFSWNKFFNILKLNAINGELK